MDRSLGRARDPGRGERGLERGVLAYGGITLAVAVVLQRAGRPDEAMAFLGAAFTFLSATALVAPLRQSPGRALVGFAGRALTLMALCGTSGALFLASAIADMAGHDVHASAVATLATGAAALLTALEALSASMRDGNNVLRFGDAAD